VTHVTDYTRPLPQARTITECESTDDKLRLAQYAADHSPGNGRLHREGVTRMYLRAFDRNGGKALPENWRSRTKVPA
jgi:hypothetical protein